jgi:hypothetical protein
VSPLLLGFTSWLYAPTLEALEDTTDKLARHGNIVGHHFQQGVPWNAPEGDPYAAPVGEEIAMRAAMSGEHPVYLAVDSLNMQRDGLPLDWTTGVPSELSAPWSDRDFDSPEVIEAYVEFASRLISALRPRYFNYGTEASELILKAPQRWPAYVRFAGAVYAQLKSKHPTLPVFISVALKSPGSVDAQALAKHLPDIAPYTDRIGLSVYPYAFFNPEHRGHPDALPKDWLSQATLLLGSPKRIAITETGWVAEDLTVSAYGLVEQSSPAEQRAYVARLIRDARALDAEFAIWFTATDYDTLWETFSPGESKNLGALWRDTGLFNEQLQARPALEVWRAGL